MTINYGPLSFEEILEAYLIWGIPPGVVLEIFHDNAATTEDFISGHALVVKADTLRQRVFCRRVRHYAKPRLTLAGNHTVGLNLAERLIEANDPAFEISPKRMNLTSIMKATWDNKEARKHLSVIPIVNGTQAVDVELNYSLQDLADIVAWEATEAFTAHHYTGRDVEALSKDHIHELMVALQREMDRESHRTGRKPGVFLDLPFERQRALAERRRWWFQQFGITPRQWKKGTFSLWKVSNKIHWPPEGFYNRYNKVGRARRADIRGHELRY